MTKRKLLQSGLALAMVVGLCAPLAASAQQTTEQIMVGENAATTSIIPTATQEVGPGQQVLFRVVNPTTQATTFSIPDVGVSYDVPPLCERTFYVGMDKVQQKQLAYYVTDASGTQLASGAVENEFYTGGVSEVALNNIINYSTAYSAPIKPEPQYYQRPVTYRKRAVKQHKRVVKHHRRIRGYW